MFLQRVKCARAPGEACFLPVISFCKPLSRTRTHTHARLPVGRELSKLLPITFLGAVVSFPLSPPPPPSFVSNQSSPGKRSFCHFTQLGAGLLLCGFSPDQIRGCCWSPQFFPAFVELISETFCRDVYIMLGFLG